MMSGSGKYTIIQAPKKLPSIHVAGSIDRHSDQTAMNNAMMDGELRHTRIRHGT
jgi:hypothetical protein